MKTLLTTLSLGVFIGAPWVAEAGGMGGHGGYHARPHVARTVPAGMFKPNRNIVMFDRTVRTEPTGGLRPNQGRWIANVYQYPTYHRREPSLARNGSWRRGEWGNQWGSQLRNEARWPAQGTSNYTNTYGGGGWYRTGYGAVQSRGGGGGNAQVYPRNAAATLF